MVPAAAQSSVNSILQWPSGNSLTLTPSYLHFPTCRSELNSILPNISFSFASASSAVNFRPSSYMVYSGYSMGGGASKPNSYSYLVYVANMGTGATQVRVEQSGAEGEGEREKPSLRGGGEKPGGTTYVRADQGGSGTETRDRRATIRAERLPSQEPGVGRKERDVTEIPW